MTDREVQDFVAREDQGSVAVLRMVHGKANVMDLEFCQAMIERLAKERESSSQAVVLTGQGSIFSAGVDLHRVVAGGSEYLRQFLPALSDMFASLAFFPKPVVVASNGHAIAGGCLLLCAADLRFMARGSGKIGVPELQVGVPFPVMALEILRMAVAPHAIQEIVYSGRTYRTEEAQARGLFDELVDPDELLGHACQAAEVLGNLPGESFRLTKEQLRRPLKRVYDQSKSMEERVIDAWASEEVLNQIRDYVDRTIGR